MEFKNGKLTVILYAQSPMIHFQYDQTGATLRASEVKPKLDRYLLRQIPEEEQKDAWFIDKNKVRKNRALDYKLRIEDTSGRMAKKSNNPRSTFRLAPYFGTLGQGYRDGAFVISEPKLTILCFNQKLQKLILNNLENFFLCHNFGTMQGKGFGSFVIQTGDKITDCDVVKALRTVGAIGEIYKIACSEIETDKRPKSYKPIFEQIHTFYKLTKSGINQKKAETDNDGNRILLDKGYARSALFLYMHKKHGLGNEKAYIKKYKLTDFKGNNKKYSLSNDKVFIKRFQLANFKWNKNPDNRNYHWKKRFVYARALLGVSATMFHIKGSNKKYVEINSEEVGRYNSPIRFKIINNKIYIYTVSNSEILDNKFQFQSVRGEGERKKYFALKELNTPKSFDISDFLAFATWYYNTCLEKLTSSLPKEKERWDERFSANDESEYINYPSEDKKANFNVKLVVNKLPEELHNKQKILIVDKGDQDDTTLPGVDHRANL